MTCGRPSRPVARRPPPSGAPGTGGPLRLAPEAEAGPRWRLRTQMEPRSPARRVAGAGGPPCLGRDWPSAGGRWARRECDGHGACDWPSMAPQDGRWTARVPDLGTDPGHRGPRPGLRVSTPSTGGAARGSRSHCGDLCGCHPPPSWARGRPGLELPLPRGGVRGWTTGGSGTLRLPRGWPGHLRDPVTSRLVPFSAELGFKMWPVGRAAATHGCRSPVPDPAVLSWDRGLTFPLPRLLLSRPGFQAGQWGSQVPCLALRPGTLHPAPTHLPPGALTPPAALPSGLSTPAILGVPGIRPRGRLWPLRSARTRCL